MGKRESGIDLLRCLGLMFVVGVHSFLKNGFYSQPQTGWAMWLADSFRWLFFGCNGIFMMLTGYLKSTKPLGRSYFRGLWAVLLGYAMTCAVSFPIRHFLLGEVLTFGQWLEKLVTFANYGWYVEMYIGLYLLSPLLNLALGQLKTKRELLLAAGVMVLLTAAPSATALDLLPDYWVGLYPLTYYIIGGVIRRLQPKIHPLAGAAGAMGLAMLLGAVSVLSAGEGFSSGFTQGYGGFWVTAMVTCLFLGLYRMQVGKCTGKVLAWAAGGCFEGYILSRLLDVWAYELLPQWHTPEKYPLLFIAVTIPIYLCAIVMGKLTHWPVERLMARQRVPAASSKSARR